MSPEKTPPWPFLDALIVTREVLAGKRGVIEGSIVLTRYAHDMGPDWALDPDFRSSGLM